MQRLSDADKQRVYAAINASFAEVNENLGDDSKRMAGAALGSLLIPSTLGMLDNQEEDWVSQYLLSPGILGVGTAAGGAIGYNQAHLSDKEKEAYADQALKDLKTKSKARAKEVGPKQAVDEYGYAKATMLDDISPIGPKYGKVFNKATKGIPVVGDIDLPNRTPREMRGMTRGALIGALASIAPAYAVLRGGELPME